MQTVIDGVLTEYQILGTKNKKSVLVLHGWGQSSKNWEYIGNKLAEKYKVYLLDLPGFGESLTPPKPFGTNDYANFVDKFIKDVVKDKLIIIGHSFGGKIAIRLASSGYAIINKLLLISPSGINQKTIVATIKMVVAKVLKTILFWLSKSAKNSLIKRLGSRDYANAGEMTETFKKIVGDMVINDAKKIKTPTIIIWGEKDEEVSLKTAKILKTLIRGSILRILWGERHSSNIEAPDKLLSIINDYV